ncbi:chromate resistance protein ChrB domain-containing protein [Pseudogulbenkiania sp. MAI-1]|uniref:chromate resistance protein ChrB domain-containing protein n=1 Tax=Pseudogulbenkiania sp. MAI-1 TaxID=990370 RepID=UPI00045E7C77|nr:chromate resistance protein ChrB domain-containing protein [Pseudogulbenkiania sp. MAI-1]
MNLWLLLITTLPTENATARMRAWRALKASGAAVLRDGVYLLPDRAPCPERLNAVAADVQSNGGTAYVLQTGETGTEAFPALFDRGGDYAELLAETARLRDSLNGDNVQETLKQARKLRKAFASLVEIDFFPGEARQQADAALRELELQANRVLSPDEPHAITGAIPRRLATDFRGRTWATRRRPWVDRLASAWLIRRFIDRDARFLWLGNPADCPSDALGFDFDGATFSHIGAKVTFEVLQASFGLEQPSLRRLGTLVHYLDVGGVQPAEAAGVERVLAGLRATFSDDDQLLQAASGVFDGLLAAFEKENDE